MEGSLYNPCQECEHKEQSTTGCEGCRYEAAKQRLAKLEEIQKKCLGAYGILGEAFEPRHDMDRRTVNVPLLHLVTAGRAGCPDMPADLRSRIAKSIGDAVQTGQSIVEVDLEALTAMVNIADNCTMGGYDEQRAFLKSLNYLAKVVKTYEVFDDGRNADG
jgi:hypothetical protein